jgi:hypothetical protein
MFDSRDETTQERSFEEERAALLTGLWDGSRAIALAERLMRLVDGSEPSLSIARRDAVDALLRYGLEFREGKWTRVAAEKLSARPRLD